MIVVESGGVSIVIKVVGLLNSWIAARTKKLKVGRILVSKNWALDVPTLISAVHDSTGGGPIDEAVEYI